MRKKGMRINDSCAACLYDKQKNKADNPKYLTRIRELLDNRGEDDTSPYMVYLFNKVHEEFFGAGADYTQVKKTYNDLVLGMEENLRAEIENAADWRKSCERKSKTPRTRLPKRWSCPE